MIATFWTTFWNVVLWLILLFFFTRFYSVWSVFWAWCLLKFSALQNAGFLLKSKKEKSNLEEFYGLFLLCLLSFFWCHVCLFPFLCFYFSCIWFFLAVTKILSYFSSSSFVLHFNLKLSSLAYLDLTLEILQRKLRWGFMGKHFQQLFAYVF